MPTDFKMKNPERMSVKANISARVSEPLNLIPENAKPVVTNNGTTITVGKSINGPLGIKPVNAKKHYSYNGQVFPV